MISYVKLSSNAIRPSLATPFAAGYDLHSAQSIVVPAKGKELIPTDIAIQLPNHCYGRIAPRSGLSWKHFIDVGAGVIDSDYRGNINVLLFNFGERDYQVNQGDRIAQLIITKVEHFPLGFIEATLDPSCRGEKGFGSTGE